MRLLELLDVLVLGGIGHEDLGAGWGWGVVVALLKGMRMWWTVCAMEALCMHERLDVRIPEDRALLAFLNIHRRLSPLSPPAQHI